MKFKKNNFMKNGKFKSVLGVTILAVFIALGTNAFAQFEGGEGAFDPGGTVNGEDSSSSTSSGLSSPGESNQVGDKLGSAGAQMAQVASQALDAGIATGGLGPSLNVSAPDFALDALGIDEVAAVLPSTIIVAATVLKTYNRQGQVIAIDILPDGWAGTLSRIAERAQGGNLVSITNR